MKRRILMVPVILAVLFLITGILYAANGDLIVNGNLGVGTATPQGKAEVNGNMVVDGNLGVGTTTPSQKLSVAGTIQSTTGGIMFPDGSVQTTADSYVGPTTRNIYDSSQRTLNTVYQNTTGKPMFLYIRVNGYTNNVTVWAGNNNNPTTEIFYKINDYGTSNMNPQTVGPAIILPGEYYKFFVNYGVYQYVMEVF